LFDAFIINTGISDYPLSNRDPLWKFVVGLNHDNKGLYNTKDFAYVSRFPLGSERKREELKLIRERTDKRRQLLSLMQLKMKIFFSDFDHSLVNYVAPGTSLTPFKLNILLYAEKCYYTLISLFMLISLGFLFFQKSSRDEYMLYLIFILGFMFIYLFIEIQIRYRYLAAPSFFILSSFGIYSASLHIKKLISRKQSFETLED
jgi:hypothetical protein